VGHSICSVDLCERQVYSRGWCRSHYDRWSRTGNALPPPKQPKTVAKCKIETCDRDSKSKGWCGFHYNRWLKFGDPEPEIINGRRVTRVGETCESDDCDRPVLARGLCSKHYDRARRNGELPAAVGMVAAPDHPTQTCTVVGCPKPQFSRNLCRMHYDRQRTTGDVGSVERRHRPAKHVICTVEGCGEPHQSRGFCRKHYDRWSRLGDPGPAGDLPPRPKKYGPDCTIDMCDKPAYMKGWCATHYGRYRRFGDPGSATIGDYKSRKGECEIADCDKPIQSSGLCRGHYARKKKYGDPMGGVWRAPRGAGSTTADGYRVLTINGKQILEHRHVMAQHLGRPLLPTESVHHKDGNRSRNVIGNLEIWLESEYRRGQPAGQRVSDLIAYIAEFHADAVRAEIRRQERERRTGQLRLEGMPAAHVSEVS